MNAPAAELIEQTHRRGGGRLGRKALRSAPIASFPTLVRNIPVYEIVPDEAVELIHDELLKILEEVGCEFRDDGAIELWKAAGADVRQTRVRIDRALLMELVSKVPPEFTLNARNPERTVRARHRTERIHDRDAGLHCLPQECGSGSERRSGRGVFCILRNLAADGFFTSKIGIQYLGYIGNGYLSEFPGCPPVPGV